MEDNLDVKSCGFEVCKSEGEWKKKLGDRYNVLRGKGTEAAFSGTLLENKKKGIYVCGACGNNLFSSETKFDSGSGWPSFFDAVSKENILLKKEGGLLGGRTEVLCKRCGSHLGHVFDDGPKPTGKRYCINSASLGFSDR